MSHMTPKKRYHSMGCKDEFFLQGSWHMQLPGNYKLKQNVVSVYWSESTGHCLLNSRLEAEGALPRQTLAELLECMRG